MAYYEKGVMGKFFGAVGTVVGSTWKGLDVMRSKMGRRRGQPSLKQQMQRAKFGVAIGFASALSKLLNFTFNKYANEKTGINYALSAILKKAVIGNYPDFKLDYSSILV